MLGRDTVSACARQRYLHHTTMTYGPYNYTLDATCLDDL
jgi:hypothetical protein